MGAKLNGSQNALVMQTEAAQEASYISDESVLDAIDD